MHLIRHETLRLTNRAAIYRINARHRYTIIDVTFDRIICCNNIYVVNTDPAGRGGAKMFWEKVVGYK